MRRDPPQGRNAIRYCLCNALEATGILFCTGTVIQTFLKVSGVSDTQIGLVVLASSMAQGAVFVLFGGFADRIFRIREATTGFTLSQAFFPLLLIPFLRPDAVSPWGAFASAMLVTVALSVCAGLRTLLAYRFLYQLMDRNRYGSLFGIDGIVTGLVGVLASVFLTISMRAAGFVRGMLMVCLSAVLCFLGAAWTNSRFEVCFPERTVQSEKAKGMLGQIKKLISSPSFRKLATAHAARGLSNGAIGFVAVLGMAHADFTDTETSYLMVAATLASIAGSGLFKVLHRYLSYERLVFGGNTLSAVGLLLMFPFGGKVWFVAFYFLSYLGMIVVSIAVPVLMYDVVPPELMGAYTAGRSMFLMVGSGAAAAILGALSGWAHPQILMTVAAASFAISGILFLRRSGPLRALLKTVRGAQ